MYLKQLLLRNFRNHKESKFDFGKGVNILFGNNGQGKTNVIEAISYLCLTKSFYASGDSVALKIDSDFFEIEGVISTDKNVQNKVRIAFDNTIPQKVIQINKQEIEPFSLIIGKFPIVICSPEHSPITSGGPSERRKFVDLIISQSNNLYFQKLMEYRRALKQRNRILTEYKTGIQNLKQLLEPWNEQIIILGSFIMRKRKLFIDEFTPSINHIYEKIAPIKETPTIKYKPLGNEISVESEEDFKSLISENIENKIYEEMKLGSSLTGPHRDEYDFDINNKNLRKYASQGQHKTFLVTLKLSEFYYLKERCSETPVLLLDDVFSELDEKRIKTLISFVENISQTILTSTSVNMLENVIDFGESNRKFVLQNGEVIAN